MTNKCLQFFFTIMLLTSFSSAGASQAMLDAGEVTSEKTLLPYYSFIIDQSKKLTIYDIASAQFTKQFNNDSLPQLLGYKNDAVWLKVTVNNDSNKEKNLFFRHTHPTTDFIDIYHSELNGKWQRQISGDKINFDNRPIDYSHTIFPVTFTAIQPKTFISEFNHLANKI